MREWSEMFAKVCETSTLFRALPFMESDRILFV
jgi:hypothetical protein